MTKMSGQMIAQMQKALGAIAKEAPSPELDDALKEAAAAKQK